MRMRKSVLNLSLVQILPEKINKMLSLINLGFISVLLTVQWLHSIKMCVLLALKIGSARCQCFAIYIMGHLYTSLILSSSFFAWSTSSFSSISPSSVSAKVSAKSANFSLLSISSSINEIWSFNFSISLLKYSFEEYLNCFASLAAYIFVAMHVWSQSEIRSIG